MQDLNIIGEITEKKAIKKAALKVGFALLAVFAVMFFAAVPIIIVTSFLGIPVERVVEFLSEPTMSMAFQAVMSIFMVLFPFLVLAKTENLKISNVINFAPPKNKITLPFIMAVSVYGFVFSIATAILLSILEELGLKAPEINTVYPTSFLGIVITVIACVILPALLEEFAMRGVVLGMLRRFGDGFAIVCSALTFGLMHASIMQIPYTFLLGIVLAVAVIKTESIWTGVILHGINNALAIVFEYCEIFYGAEKSHIIELITICLMIIISVIGIILLLKADPQAFKIETSKTATDEKKKYMCFILSPTIILGVILSFVFGFLLR